jgi:hypothetical protein
MAKCIFCKDEMKEIKEDCVLCDKEGCVMCNYTGKVTIVYCDKDECKEKYDNLHELIDKE